MSKKIKDQEVLLVKDQKDDSLRAVVGADGKSGLKLHSFKVSFESLPACMYTNRRLLTTNIRKSCMQMKFIIRHATLEPIHKKRS
mgnify:CR=1 FL=1